MDVSNNLLRGNRSSRVRRRTRQRLALLPLALLNLLLMLSAPCLAADHPKEPDRPGITAIWSKPGDMSSRNLLFGSGGEKDEPHLPVTFEKESSKGTNPKFDVRDQDGDKWKVKLGIEARPETVAARLLWAIGYFTEEDYFVPNLKVEGMPHQLKRGQQFVKHGNEIDNVRLKRHPKHAEEAGEWRWRNNPFTGTRELNGLRVMMAVINNWDLKDENNTIYDDKDSGKQLYMVTDLGASFGTNGYRLGPGRGKGNLGDYKHSKFITHIRKDSVDFGTPAHSTILGILGIFSIPDFIHRMKLRWIGRHIPRQDARWMGDLLAQLKPEQIEDAFRAAGYSDKDVLEYAQVVEKRIADLEKL